MPRDPFISEKFTRERSAARKAIREYFQRFPKERYHTEVESWRHLQSQNIEFTKAEHEAAEWQAAMEALILVATSGGPTMFARIGIMRALNAGKPDPAIVPRRKGAKAYRVIR
jgi:hypothetical protein